LPASGASRAPRDRAPSSWRNKPRYGSTRPGWKSPKLVVVEEVPVARLHPRVEGDPVGSVTDRTSTPFTLGHPGTRPSWYRAIVSPCTSTAPASAPCGGPRSASPRCRRVLLPAGAADRVWSVRSTRATAGQNGEVCFEVSSTTVRKRSSFTCFTSTGRKLQGSRPSWWSHRRRTAAGRKARRRNRC
jgi:hypothetical protein